MLVEGPAGVGKTELAKALAAYLGRELVRLQCYEGLDEAKALYEWNYRKQLLRIQAEASGTGWDAVQEDIFGEEFLLARPLMTAIASEQPVVLLIDEIDKTDQEFEAMLLEVLSDFQISIPELGRVESRTHPIVLLTSNNSRELTEALKRRCLYLWLDYPALEHELEIVRLHAPELSETVARRLVEVIGMVRELDLKKPPSIAESIDWARALLLLGAAGHRRGHLHRDDVGDRQAPDRHGRGGRPRRAQAPLTRRMSPEDASEGLPARILELGEELRREGVAVGTSEMLDAFEVLREISWTSQEDFREALAATLAKSQEDRRVFELVFDRFFFRSVEIAAAREGIREGALAELDELSESELDALRAQIAAALRDGDEGAMRDLARMAIAAFARRQEGSGVIGVDVQRISRALGLRAEPQPELPVEDPRHEGLPRDALRRFEALLRRELERSQIERTGNLPPSRPLGELDRALPSGRRRTSRPSTGSSRSCAAGWPPRGCSSAVTAAMPMSTCAARCAPRCRREASPSS